jgi:hypothetical protein
LPLNAIGDFLAGFFSSVVYLCLVVGYFQQGEGLKVNIQALEAQIKELRMSVEQQANWLRLPVRMYGLLLSSRAGQAFD